MAHALFYRYSVAGMAGAYMAFVLHRRRFDQVPGEDPFSKHTREQTSQHPISGMHSPFIPTAQQRCFVQKNFPQAAHFLPESVDDFQKQQAVQTSVKIESLSSCPIHLNSREAKKVLVVGGPHALISSTYDEDVIYLNAERRPIVYESALHLEWDAQSDAQAHYLPSQFVIDQLFRLMKYESLSSAAETGQFSWRSLDWIGWLKHPEHWGEGIRIALAFQKVVRADQDPDHREATLRETAKRTKKNERFYKHLDRELDGQLLSSADGSLIVARTLEERGALLEMQKGLMKESRFLLILSKEEVQERYGFVPPNGIAFGEKIHDKALSLSYMQLLADRVEKTGGKVIQGILAKIYVDNPMDGGIALYYSGGKERYVPFSKLVASLDNQRILGKDGYPLFDSVSSRSVSAMALAYVPKGKALPEMTVCGGTNHIIKLADPVEMRAENGEVFDVYLLRMTAGACITPNVFSADYDGTAAVGLITAARQTLDCDLEVLAVHGYNSQMNAYGESHWMALQPPNHPDRLLPWAPRGHELDMGPARFPHPVNGVYIQMGTGKGLSHAPAQSGQFLE